MDRRLGIPVWSGAGSAAALEELEDRCSVLPGGGVPPQFSPKGMVPYLPQWKTDSSAGAAGAWPRARAQS